ncbi:hypothetical protein N431DRAFT_456606 [Stipitochalara longipes BDJ]|nr:hypothetical protein N431DRAFT_456606 [Stipitochalara longipes BDJ]
MGYFWNLLAFLAVTSSIANALPQALKTLGPAPGSPTPFTTPVRLSPPTCTDCCGASSISGIDPPWANAQDCADLILGLQSPTTWIVPQNMDAALVSSGGCGFYAEVDYNTGDTSIQRYIGSDDVLDLISSAILALQNNGMLGAHGNMGCQDGQGGYSSVYWGIFAV